MYDRSKDKKNAQRGNAISFLLLLMTSLLVIVVAAAALLAEQREAEKEEADFAQLVLLLNDCETAQPSLVPAEPSADRPLPTPLGEGSDTEITPQPDVEEPEESRISGSLTTLYALNSDLGGWIRISGTAIDYPVMFTPNHPQKYLHLSFSGEKSSAGVPFIGEGCAIWPHSDNIVIFGHHMKSGSMFAALVKYQNIEFWQTHPIIHFSSLYQENDYEVFAVLETDVQEAETLRCYSFIHAQDEDDFNRYIEKIENASLYDTGIEVSYGDALLTLSTCAYHTDNGRFIVVAKRK